MARYTDAVCRLCRREGQKLFLKGEKCYTDKCPVARREYAPGQHGRARKKMSEYGLQLREKQKARRIYGVLEKQFRNYFDKASKQSGVTGENLLAILESRLDNVVYRMGLGTSRAEARQLVRHGHITVNGRRVNIPSYLLSVNDVVALAEQSRGTKRIEEVLDITSGRTVPNRLDFDRDKLTATVVGVPTKDDLDVEIQEHLIVELYSK